MNNQARLDAQHVKRMVDSFEADLLGLLDKMVSVNSFSHNLKGVARVAELLAEFLPPSLELDRKLSSEDEPLCLCRHGPTGERPLLLVGHLDTVFPPSTFDSATIRQGPYIFGPGVADMKGGIVVIIGALRILDYLSLLPNIPLILAFNGDEEIGSPRSAEKLTDLARSSRLGLVFECGGPQGAVVTSRRGLQRYRLEIEGEAGHPGTHQGAKHSAVVELAQQILKLESLNDPAAGISVNVGRVHGGSAANVIPGEAGAELEVRFLDQEQGDQMEERIRALANRVVRSTLKITFHKNHGRPAMVRTPATVRLHQAAARTAARVNLLLPEEPRGGASDANLLSAAGLPTLDGLGPEGEMDHSTQERILKDSLFQRVELLVHLLWDLRDWKQE